METTDTLTVPAAAGDTPGITMNVILSTECSAGKLTILEQEISVGAGSAQTCTSEDKVILVAEGKFILTTETGTYTAEKGTNLFIPGGTPHSLKNTGTSNGKLLITLTPASPNGNKKVQSVRIFGKSTANMQHMARKYDVELV